MNEFSADEQPLPVDFGERVIELMRRVEAESARLDALEIAEHEEHERLDEERARRARAGALGPDWRAVQQRIDLNQTTLEEVFSGADESPAADALRRSARSNFARLRELWDEQEDGEDEPTPLDLLDQVRTASAAHYQQAAAHIEAVLNERLRREGTL
ncbi:hypothetical protein CW368_01185 [Actinomycetales bacterium SN12]|nr:hypothetical protein CW368_01185 [Actinomycetales bacterium SN12]